MADLLPAIGYFKASNTGADDDFGASIALSADGTTMAVGARTEDSSATGVNGDQADDATINSGAVYVFTRDDGAWSQQAYIKPSNTGAWDHFGTEVALSGDGNTLAVGAPREDSNGIGNNPADNSATDSGAVYVFVREAGNWSQQAYIKAFNAQSNDVFGESVALSSDGNTLAVGASLEDSSDAGVDGDHTDNAAENSGAAYVFTRSGSNWSQSAYLKSSNPERFDLFGRTVALSGDGSTLAVGADSEDSSATGVNGDQTDNSADESGAVYVFTHEAGTWSQQAYLKASNPDAYDGFSFALSLSGDGNTLAVGSFGEASSAAGVDGDSTDNLLNNSGAVYVFAREERTWSQQAYIKASNPGELDFFGLSVALSADGNKLAAGALEEDGSARGINGAISDSARYAGAAYLFTRDAGVWSQQAYIKASNTETEDYFGGDVAISADGETLAVSASESSSATGINGDQDDNSARSSGAVYLY
ncbi:hypothetical protein ACXYTJ_07960 [Gilvimarinus sp. F26214L]|uniref:hypothetical protein n=1 Tax=Gilvimarinus sp. DZF01 TaxID=3461371 RepID=UPI00404578B8